MHFFTPTYLYLVLAKMEMFKCLAKLGNLKQFLLQAPLAMRSL